MATVILSWVDQLMVGLPELARLMLWALLAAAVSMTLYRLTSPQAALRQIRGRRAELQARLRDFDGPLGGAMPLLASSLRLAFAQLLRVLWPTAVAALPLIVLIVWLDLTYGYRFPSPDSAALVSVETDPPAMRAQLRNFAGEPGAGATGWVVTLGESAPPVQAIALDLPVPVIHKLDWWNAVIGNPAGYLPNEALVDAISLDLPYREYLPVGPGWLRAWYVAFFAVLFAASLAIKLRFRIL